MNYLIILFSFQNSQGYEFPRNYNPPDFFIKNLAIDPINRQNCLNKVNVSLNILKPSNN
jgi:hypothetical protein